MLPLPKIIDKSMLSLLMLSLVSVLALKPLLEMVKDMLCMTSCCGVDKFFHRIGQYMVLNSWPRKSSAGHSSNKTNENTKSI